jgi:hypothetical protein
MLIINSTVSLGSTSSGFVDSEALVQFLVQIYSHELFQLYLPWVSSILAIIVMSKMVTGVRMRKEGIVMIALFVQLFFPMPYIEPSPKIEQVEVKKSKEKEC